jgi:hypothetical protein
MTFKIEHINAKSLWFIVLFIVLSMLFLQTYGVNKVSDNLLIDGDITLKGALVAIDGQTQGVLAPYSEGGFEEAYFRTHLKPGKHVLLVSKPGFKPCICEWQMGKEAYVPMQLKKI